MVEYSPPKFHGLAGDIDAAQIQNNLGFGIWHLNLGFSI
jgi:hypothetical protein